MYYSSLSSTSQELTNGRNHPKSRSQLHHHQYHHRHHHPSSSSSLSAFSQPQLLHQQFHQRASAVLIDEYGNQHDPEHCRFKTLATTTHHDSSSSTQNSSRRSSLSSVTSASTHHHHHHHHHHHNNNNHNHSWPPCSPSSTSSHNSLPRLAPPSTSCWAMLKPRQHANCSTTPSPTLTTSSSWHSRTSWSRSLWAHLSRPATVPAVVVESPPLIYTHHPLFQATSSPTPNSLSNSLSSQPPNPVHLSAIRKHVELVKLEVWKQRTTCKKS
ncbi:hypothetical protein VP01_2495g1 [Puccinia sorghi]|uniref:Uncharacterized protein n=1 Tax=Puccinia sorghi TaxID=27349 RepID=A0A0L6V5S1_9BASI|nr:hypothetical protein VP01_2495g1 [Puccinia sorghi]